MELVVPGFCHEGSKSIPQAQVFRSGGTLAPDPASHHCGIAGGGN
jgi:hypothetical protein